MARLQRPGAASSVYAQDDCGQVGPIMHWGKVHRLIPTEATAARNGTAFSANAGVVRILAQKACYWKLGNSSVAATVLDNFLPANQWVVVPLWKDLGNAADHISFISETGSGITSAYIIENVDA